MNRVYTLVLVSILMYVSWIHLKLSKIYDVLWVIGLWDLTGDAKNLLVEIRCKAYSSFHLWWYGHIHLRYALLCWWKGSKCWEWVKCWKERRGPVGLQKYLSECNLFSQDHRYLQFHVCMHENISPNSFFHSKLLKNWSSKKRWTWNPQIRCKLLSLLSHLIFLKNFSN